MNEQDGQLIPRRNELLPAAVAGPGVAGAAGISPTAETPALLFQPQMDIYETDDGLVLYADLPGVTLDGLELQVQDKKTDFVWSHRPECRRDRAGAASGVSVRTLLPLFYPQR